MWKQHIPVVVQKTSAHSFWMDNILAGMRQIVSRQNYSLTFIDPKDIEEQRGWDGMPVLVVGYLSDWLQAVLEALSKRGLKPIVVNGFVLSFTRDPYSGVYFELEKAVNQSVEYLMRCGKAHIALVGVNARSAADGQKKKAFLECMKAHDLDGSVFSFDRSLSDCVDSFIEAFPDTEIDACICANDTVGLYLINSMVNMGYKIPKDVFVVGMGDSMLGKSHRISLTTIRLDYMEMGRQAIHLWQYIRKSDTDVQALVYLPCQLVVRDSTDNLSPGRTAQPQDMAEGDGDYYGNDSDMRRIIGMEDFLQNCDDLDRAILRCLLAHETYEHIAERVGLTDRAVRYRVSKMIRDLGVQNKEEILDEIKALSLYHED